MKNYRQRSRSFVVLEVGLEVFELELLVEGVHELLLEVLGPVQVPFPERHPDFHSEVEQQGRVEPRRDEPDPVHLLALRVVLAQEVEDQPLVDFFVVLVLAVDLENEPASHSILGVLPSRRDAVTEVVNGVDLAELPVDQVAELSRVLPAPCVFVRLALVDEVVSEV